MLYKLFIFPPLSCRLESYQMLFNELYSNRLWLYLCFWLYFQQVVTQWRFILGHYISEILERIREEFWSIFQSSNLNYFYSRVNSICEREYEFWTPIFCFLRECFKAPCLKSESGSQNVRYGVKVYSKSEIKSFFFFLVLLWSGGSYIKS